MSLRHHEGWQRFSVIFLDPGGVAGGWAIDLYLGHPSRPHKDLEIAILRIDQSPLPQYLRGWAFAKILPHTGGRMEPWQDGRSSAGRARVGTLKTLRCGECTVQPLFPSTSCPKTCQGYPFLQTEIRSPPIG